MTAQSIFLLKDNFLLLTIKVRNKPVATTKTSTTIEMIDPFIVSPLLSIEQHTILYTKPRYFSFHYLINSPQADLTLDSCIHLRILYYQRKIYVHIFSRIPPHKENRDSDHFYFLALFFNQRFNFIQKILGKSQ